MELFWKEMHGKLTSMTKVKLRIPRFVYVVDTPFPPETALIYQFINFAPYLLRA
jgi:hypothetical protein